MKSILAVATAAMAILFCSCQEIEKIALLRTELESQSDSVLVVKGVLLDIPDGASVVEYGHCWSDQHEPTIADMKLSSPSAGNNSAFAFTSRVREFRGKQAYFFRSFVSFHNGEVIYGNTITINTGTARGRWTQIPFSNSYTIRVRSYHTNGIEEDLEVKDVFVFQEIVLYQNDLFKLNGKINTWLKAESSEKFELASNAIYASASESTVEKLNGSEWSFHAKPQAFVGYGKLSLVAGNFLYHGAGSKNWGGYEGYPPYDLYSDDSYPVGDPFGGAFFRYDLQNGISQELAVFPGPYALFSTHFSIGSKIFKVSGWDGYDGYLQDVWVYNIQNNTWIQLNDFPGQGRMHASCFVLNGKAYMGLGFAGIGFYERYDESHPYPTDPVDDFWEYNPEDDTWTKLTDFPGGARAAAFSFALQDFGYIGTGMVAFTTKYKKDFWRFNPSDKTWLQMDDFPGNPRFGASACANGQKAVIGFGWRISNDAPPQIPLIGDPYGTGERANIYFPELDTDLWQFDPSLN
jgi:hypothetical protein